MLWPNNSFKADGFAALNSGVRLLMDTSMEPWLANAKASPDALNALLSAVPTLPQSYIDLLSRGNGGEVELPTPPFNFCLDSAEAALDYWGSGTYTLQDAFVFGGDGGGSLIAFDMRGTQPWPIICFDPIDPKGSMEQVAVDFPSFLSSVAQGSKA